MYDHIVCESPQLPAGVTVTALMKDLLPPPPPAAAAAAAGGGGKTMDGSAHPPQQQQQRQQQQQQDETLRLLHAEIPALGVLQRLAAQEAAVAAAKAAAAAAAAAGGRRLASTPGKQLQGGSSSSQGTPQQQQQQQQQQSPAGSAREAEEAMIVAALTGVSPPPPGSNASLAAAAVAAVAGSTPQRQQQQRRPLMSNVEVAMAISELHHELRGCCDMMDIGLGGGGAPRKGDTVAEVSRRFLTKVLGLAKIGFPRPCSPSFNPSHPFPALFMPCCHDRAKDAGITISKASSGTTDGGGVPPSPARIHT
jgi:hypothetical protein